MRISHATALVSVIAALVASPAQAHLVAKPKDNTLKAQAASQKENLAHARYVCKHGKGQHKGWSCKAVTWLSKEYRETQILLSPPSVYSQAYGQAKKLGVPDSVWHGCAVPLINRENAATPSSWSTTRWNGAGSGAYGLGQALPASKMSAYGSDYMTSPATQIRWMHAYVTGRYGGWCEANSYQLRNNYY